MSIQTWKAEYYPVDARDAISTDLQAVRHSILKWQGLSLKVLEKHGLIPHPGYGAILTDAKKAKFWVSSETCALCVKYDSVGDTCGSCPLFKQREGVSCAVAKFPEPASPYRQFTEHGDPEPMLEWLLATEATLATPEAENELITLGLTQALDKLASVRTLQALGPEQWERAMADAARLFNLTYSPPGDQS